MRDKSVKYRKVSDERAKQIKRLASGDACKYQFMLWAASAQLDVTGIHEGYPIFRPAIVAWEAWQTAWNLSNRKKRRPPPNPEGNMKITEHRAKELLHWHDDMAGDHTVLFEAMTAHRDTAALIRQLQAEVQDAWQAGLDEGRAQGAAKQPPLAPA